jgi:hypothetical protein
MKITVISVAAPCSQVHIYWLRHQNTAFLMDIVRISETSVNFCQTTVRNVPEHNHLQCYSCFFSTVFVLFNFINLNENKLRTYENNYQVTKINIILDLKVIIVIIIILLYSPSRALHSPVWGFVTITFLRDCIVSPAPNPQPGGPGLRIYDPRRQGGPAIPPGTGYPS